MRFTEQDDTKREIAIEARASADGAFAIAFALLRMTDAFKGIAGALHRLGTADAATPMGAIEVLSGEVGRVADAIQSVADNLDAA